MDELADHAEQLIELLEAAPLVTCLAILGTERSYRQEYLDLIFGDSSRAVLQLSPLKLNECLQLMERYRSPVEADLQSQLDAEGHPSNRHRRGAAAGACVG